MEASPAGCRTCRRMVDILNTSSTSCRHLYSSIVCFVCCFYLLCNCISFAIRLSDCKVAILSWTELKWTIIDASQCTQFQVKSRYTSFFARLQPLYSLRVVWPQQSGFTMDRSTSDRCHSRLVPILLQFCNGGWTLKARMMPLYQCVKKCDDMTSTV